VSSRSEKLGSVSWPEGTKLNQEEVECLNCLRGFCEKKNLNVSYQIIYRFAIFHGFNVRRASNAIAEKHDHPLLHLRMEEDLSRFMKQVMMIFPLPGLKSATGSNVLYFRPSRFFPSRERNRLLIENMCYVLNDMSQSIEDCQNGILMIVNTAGYTLKNFHKDCQVKLAKIMEGHVIPTHLVIVIVNPPSVLEAVLPAMTLFFSKRMKIIKSAKIGSYLMEGYEPYLPDEFLSGGKNTAALVEDYVNAKLSDKTDETQEVSK